MFLFTYFRRFYDIITTAFQQSRHGFRTCWFHRFDDFALSLGLLSCPFKYDLVIQLLHSIRLCNQVDTKKKNPYQWDRGKSGVIDLRVQVEYAVCYSFFHCPWRATSLHSLAFYQNNLLVGPHPNTPTPDTLPLQSSTHISKLTLWATEDIFDPMRRKALRANSSLGREQLHCYSSKSLQISGKDVSARSQHLRGKWE